MTRVARLFFIIAGMSTAGSCSIELAEKKETDTKAMGRQLTDAYYSCVRTSFASQRPTMVDRNMAVDQAFMVCQNEEAKLQAFEDSFSFGPPRDAERGTLAAIDDDRAPTPRSAQTLPGLWHAVFRLGLSALNAIVGAAFDRNASRTRCKANPSMLWPDGVIGRLH